ncbi:MAG: hypothetical protein M3Y65_13930 [Pseudomonadota bacterium]|nr:hypothetical protein [Pseudomonadota bacterium]
MIKRFIVMLGLAFLFQMSSGMAGSYCMHESGGASQHFGHHQHEHHATAGDDNGSSSIKKMGADPDCASCSHASLAMFSWSADVHAPAPSSHHAPAEVRAAPTPWLGLPERPNWMQPA